MRRRAVMIAGEDGLVLQLKRKRRGTLLGAVGAVALTLASSAQAATVTVGQLSAPNTFPCIGTVTYLQTGVASGASYTVPQAGVLTSWSFQAGATTVTGLKLKVGRSAGGGSYTITGEATAGAQTANSVNTFMTNIPVQAGDLIGLTQAGGDCVTTTGSGSDTLVGVVGDQGPGTNLVYTAAAGYRFPITAQVTLQPGVSSVTPASGPADGGTHVTITGHDFTGAPAVSFGGVPAASFTVDSDSSISATVPAGVGAVDVTVTTPGGQSPTSAADKFTYIPRPVVSSVSPASGPRTGGTTVTISGTGMTDASAVSFGGVPARHFTVNSDTTITAVAPAASVGSVDVTVTTAGGQSAASTGDRFAFSLVCVVPKAKGKKLKAAKKALKHAHCSLGKAKGPRAGRVKRQSRKPGVTVPLGTKVNIKLA